MSRDYEIRKSLSLAHSSSKSGDAFFHPSRLRRHGKPPSQSANLSGTARQSGPFTPRVGVDAAAAHASSPFPFGVPSPTNYRRDPRVRPTPYGGFS